MASRYRSLLWRLFLAVFLVLAFTGVAWDQTGDNGKYLGLDFAIGVALAVLAYVTWWGAKRSYRAGRAAFREAYGEVTAVRGDHARRLARLLGAAHGRASRPEHRDAMVREAAGHAGRFVGTLRRAFREGYGSGGNRAGEP